MDVAWKFFGLLCAGYQRFANLADGNGFRTDKHLDNTSSRNDHRSQRRRQKEVNGGHSGPPQWLIDEAVREIKLNNRINRAITGITEQCDLCTGAAISAAERGRSLRIIHNEPPLNGTADYEKWNKKSTQEIIDSLAPGNPNAELTIYPDGAIVNGNTRIAILMERGVDVNSLPAAEIERVPMDDLGIPEP